MGSNRPIFLLKLMVYSWSRKEKMRLRLLIKQAIKDFKNKLQLYISFAIFIMISSALILGLFSFTFTAESDFNAVVNSTLPINQQIKWFKFFSVNSDEIEELKDVFEAKWYQVENGKLTEYVYDDVLVGKTLQINAEGNVYRPFTDAEMKILWGDVGFDWNPTTKAKTKNLKTYNPLNMINQMGNHRGWVQLQHIQIYKDILKLTDADVAQIFDEKGEIRPNLEQNPNYVRFAAFNKISFFARDYERWFSMDPKDEFYDRNQGYDSNLLLKYIYEVARKKVQQPGSALSKAGYTLEMGLVPSSYYDRWRNVDGKVGVQVVENIMPVEKWMEDAFVWEDTDPNRPVKGWTENWSHVPDIAKRGPLSNLVIYERLSKDKIDPKVLASGAYAYVNPLFLHEQGYKLGDQITFFSNRHATGKVTVTIIGTAVSKLSLDESGQKSSVYMPFKQIIKRNADSWKYMYSHMSFIEAGEDYDKATELLKKYLYEDFTKVLIPRTDADNFPPPNPNWYPYNRISISLYFYNLISYVVAIITLLLLCVVFYFITDQSIKLQKRTLWFLKCMGETNIRLSLITTLSSVVPVIVGILLGIVTSFGVSQIMISISGTFLPLYFNPFGFNLKAIWLLLGLLVLFFLMFLIMNFAIIRGKKMQISEHSKIGFVTKLYIWIKPIFKYLPAKARIGNSFIAKNLFKNLLTFILLTISFGAVLFSSQFKSSSVESAHSFENRYTPYSSVVLSKRSVNDSINWNFNYLNEFFPNIQNTLGSDNMKPFNELFEEISYSKGAITTYKIEGPNGTTYKDVETNEVIELTPIKTENGQSGNIQFNSLIKKQIDELFTIGNDYYDHQPADQDYRPAPLNPQYDLRNHYFDVSYSKELILEKTAASHAEEIFAFTDQELNQYVEKFKQLINKVEARYGVTILYGTPDQVAGLLKQFIINWRIGAVMSLTEQIGVLRGATNQMRDSDQTFNGDLNVYFNRDIIPENEERTTFAFDMRIWGRPGSGIGLDHRLPKMYNKIVNPYKPIELNNDNFSTLYPFKFDDGEVKNVPVLDVYMSGNFADNLKASVGQVFEASLAGLAYNQTETPVVYIKVNRIIRQASYLRELYFNKIDLFKYLKVSLERKAIEQANKNILFDEELEPVVEDNNELDPIVEAALNKRQDYKFIKNAIERLTNADNPNAKDLFENSVFSIPNVPYGIKNFTMSGTFGSGVSILGYSYWPFLNYASQKYFTPEFENQDYGIYIFNAITKRLLNILNPIILVLDRFIILLILITIAVALILITLILLENKTVILLFKSLGYKKSEVNVYLTVGYIIATILALILGTVIAYFGIKFMSTYLVQYLQISLFFVWSPSFVLFGLVMALVFITMTLSAVNIYTRHQKPKDAFETL